MNIEVSTFKIVKESGANGTIKLSGTAILLPDTGDKVEFAISAPVAGKYKIVQKVRLGDKSRNNNMAGAYIVAVDDKVLTYTVGTPDALESRFGGSYWGSITEEVSLTAGAHRLSVESKASYTGIDNPIEITLIEAAAPPVAETVLKSVYDTLSSNYASLVSKYNSLQTEAEGVQKKLKTVTDNYAVLKACLSVDEASALDKLTKILQSIKAIDSIIQ
jgi:hypothetical protein